MNGCNQDVLFHICEWLTLKDVIQLCVTSQFLRDALNRNAFVWRELYYRGKKSKKQRWFSDFKKRVFLQEQKAIEKRVELCQKKTGPQWRDLYSIEYRKVILEKAVISLYNQEIQKYTVSLHALRNTPYPIAQELTIQEDFQLQTAKEAKLKAEAQLLKSEKMSQMYSQRYNDWTRLVRLKRFCREMHYVPAKKRKTPDGKIES